MDHGHIVAEGAPRELITQHSTPRGAGTAFRHRESDLHVADSPGSPSASKCCRTASASTSTTATRRCVRCTHPGSRPRARRATLHARGRLLAPHRSHAGRLMSTTDAATSDFGHPRMADLVSRTAVPRGVLPPDVARLGDQQLLVSHPLSRLDGHRRGPPRDRAHRHDRGPLYLQFVAPDSSRSRRCSWPRGSPCVAVLGAVKWVRPTTRRWRHRSEPEDVVTGKLGWVGSDFS